MGIGTVYEKDKDSLSYERYYRRAYEKRARNNIWKGIKRKTLCETEILMESDDYDFIKQKEIEFIKLYGRIDLDTGCLSNMTAGGDGIIDVLRITSKRVYHRESSTFYKSVEECSQITGISVNILYKELAGRSVSKNGLIYIDDWVDGKRLEDLMQDKRIKKVINLETKEIYNSIKEVADLNSISEKTLACKLAKSKYNNTVYQLLSEYEKGAPLNKTDKPHKYRVKVINTNTGVIYESQSEAYTKEGITSAILVKYLKNKNGDSHLIRLSDNHSL